MERQFQWMTGEPIGDQWECYTCGSQFRIEDIPEGEFFFVCPNCHRRGVSIQCA